MISLAHLHECVNINIIMRKSWDCFDTLVARRYKHPHTIFGEISVKIGRPDFPEKRRRAERRSDGTYDGIYRQLPEFDREIEFQVELEHCFPIQKNINAVQDGDLIISDMYLEPFRVEQILRNVGLTKDVQVIVTKDGKRHGWIWSTLPRISHHTGDNLKSDVQSPMNAGILATHYTEHEFTAIERNVAQYDEQLALWMRYTRLHCPYDDRRKQFWLDQSSFNLPALALGTLELPNEPLAFTYRDSVYWHPLYETMTKKTANVLYTSRKCYVSPSSQFRTYVEAQTENRVIIDLQGSGASLSQFFGDKPYRAMYMCGHHESKSLRVIAGSFCDAIERHNRSSLCQLIDWTHDGPVYGKCEHSTSSVEAQSRAMHIAIAAAPYYSIQPNHELLVKAVRGMKRNFTYMHR